MRSLWRNRNDFMGFDWFDFSKFEEVVTTSDAVIKRVRDVFTPYSIPDSFSKIIGLGIYDYCYGKLVNLKNVERWEHNFYGEVSVYLLERARYLQAYARDVNTNIDDDGSKTVYSDGETISGTTDTRKTGSVENAQTSAVQGSNQQQGTTELGDTLTVLNNQTTSTRYLASSNEESYSKGAVSETSGSGFDKEDSSKINLGIENGSQLHDEKDTNVTKTVAVKSPLDIASQESDFNFQEWFEDLFAILDKYFTPGGVTYA